MDYSWKHIQPLSGLLDNQSTPDQIQPGSWSYRLNFYGPEKDTIARIFGWRPPFFESDDTYNNADLHDQLLPLDASNPVIEPINFMREFRSTVGDRVLVAATRNRIYRFNAQNKNWQLLHKNLGSGSITNSSWQAAQVLDTVIFTNNYSNPKAWIIGKSPDSSTTEGVLTDIYDLRNGGPVNMSRASAVYAWKGLMFFGDVVEDGQRVEHRVRWSDLNKPLSYSPAADGTVSGYQDLSFGERVIAFMELSDYLLIYTTKAIWQVTIVASQELLNFRRAYPDPKNGESCLFYRNSLFSTGDSHYYCGKDDIYRFNLGLSKPEPIEWISRATNSAFKEMQPSRCELIVSGYSSGKKQAIVSYPSTTNIDAADKSVVLDFKSETAHLVDYGFTAFCSYAPDEKLTLRDFMVEGCICSIDQLQDGNQEWVWEGLPREDITRLCQKTPTCFITETTINVDGLVVEDYNKADTPDQTSLCSLFAQRGWNRIEDLCHDCEPVSIDLAASGLDYCVKELTDEVYGRYLCDSNPNKATSVNKGVYTCRGTYTSQGYYSILISGPMKIEKTLKAVEVDIDIDGESTVPPELQLSIGCSSQPSNPTDPKFPIIWRDQVINKKYIKSQTNYTADQLKQRNLKPAGSLRWPLHITGPYVYLKFTVMNQDGTPPTSGAFRFTRVSLGF